MDMTKLLFALALFIAVALLLTTVFMTWNASRGQEARRIARRLQNLTSAGDAEERAVSLLKKRPLSGTPTLQHLLERAAAMQRLDRMLEQAGLKINVTQFCLTILVCSIVAALVMLALRVPPALAIVGGGVVGALPLMFALEKRRKRLLRIEEQLPDALDLMSRSLRAGHALPSALKMVADEMGAPLAQEFRILSDEINYGVSFPDALRSLAVRVPSPDIGNFVVAVLIQRESGGNLTELMANLAALIRERLILAGQVRVFSAEGRLSAWILGLLPFVLAGFLQVTNPQFLGLLWHDPTGQQILRIMAVLMTVGVLWMRKLTRIRV